MRAFPLCRSLVFASVLCSLHLCFGGVVISEFLAENNHGLTDEDGDASDWIELYNDGVASVDLAGWRLTDEAANPTKWTFPTTTLDSRSYLVVFASTKNRSTAGQPLHTNFKLDPQGEYLALIQPDGALASSYAPAFAAQREDISCGIARIDSGPPLVSIDTPARIKVPTNNTLAATWMTETFADTTWTLGKSGMGWDSLITDGLPPNLMGYWNFDGLTSTPPGTDSSGRGLAGVVTGATQTAGGTGHTGLAGDRAMDFGTPGEAKVMQIPMGTPGAFDAAVTANKITISLWINGGPSLPNQHALFGMFTNADGSGDRSAFVHLPWTDSNIYFDTGGCCGGTETRIYKNEPNPDNFRGRWNHYVFLKDGDRKEIWQNGKLWLSGTNTFPITAIRSFFIGGLAGGAYNYPGLIDDVAVWGGALTATDIQALYSGTPASALYSYLPFVKTNVKSSMWNISVAAYMRAKFTLSAPLPSDGLALRMRYDDGFIAYLNGVEVARRNVPANPGYNIGASSNRAKPAAITQEEIDLTPYLNLLHTGTNVLAVLGCNDTKLSNEFLIQPELVTFQRVAGRYFPDPTPGTPNSSSVAGFVEDTKFTMDRGFYNGPLQTTITTTTPGAKLVYTTDGSQPSATNGIAIQAAANQTPQATLSLASSTPIRAVAMKPDFLSTNIDTHTYLYTSTAISQPVSPQGYHTTWGTYGAWGPLVGQPVPADYEMDPEVVAGALPGHTVADGLLSLPAVCLSIAEPDLFSAETGIYANSLNYGDEWTRPASLEIIYPDGSPSYMANIGLRMHGGVSRHHWDTVKHSFTLLFQDQFGPTRLKHQLYTDSPVDSFDEITLRASSTDSWPVEVVDPNEWPNYRATYIRDPWMKDTLGAMGRPTGHNRYVNLFLNGLYWGQYNMAEPHVGGWQEEYLGGDKEDYDILKDVNELESGSRQAWDEMHTLANSGMTTEADYQRIMGNNPDGTRNPAYPVYIDMPNFIDYMILHIYSAARDWPAHNWWAARKRTADSTGFKFFVWDQELTNMNLSWTTTYSGELVQAPTNAGTPGGLYDKLRQNPHFRRDFGDRVQALCFNGGLLTPAQNDARWKRRQNEIDQSIVAESARWGDSRQAAPYTREANWLPEVVWQETVYWQQNHQNALARFRSVNLLPTVEAASFNQNGGNITAGFQLTMSAPEGVIYFTTNGADPFGLDDLPSASAQIYSAALVINADTRVKARVQAPGGLSALTEALFIVAVPASAQNLVVSEIHYYPVPGGAEFIELMNVSAQPVDLGGVKLAAAVDFTFPPGSKLEAGQRILVVENVTEFNAAYGPGLPMAGAYVNKLNNGGESLIVQDANGAEIWRIDFAPVAPWPAGANGSGPSLTLVNPQVSPASNNAGNWRLSSVSGGTPGTGDATAFSGNPLGDMDHDGLTAFLEYGLGTSDTNGTSGPGSVTLSQDPMALTVTHGRNLQADDVLLYPEVSTDLVHWDVVTYPFQISSETPNGDGTSTVVWRTVDPVREPTIYVRVKAASR